MLNYNEVNKMNEKIEKQIISIQIPSDLAEKLRVDSETRMMSLSAFIRGVLIEYYSRRDNDIKSTNT